MTQISGDAKTPIVKLVLGGGLLTFCAQKNLWRGKKEQKIKVNREEYKTIHKNMRS